MANSTACCFQTICTNKTHSRTALKDDALQLNDEDRDGEYFADIEEDLNDADETSSVFINDDREISGAVDEEIGLPIDESASDTSSIINQLCLAEEPIPDIPDENNGSEILGGAEVPLTLEGEDEDLLDGRRRSIVNGLEEELPVPVFMVVMRFCDLLVVG